MAFVNTPSNTVARFLKTPVLSTLMALLAFAFASCETVVDVNLPDVEPKLVVNGYFSPDSVVKVNITKSQQILDNASFQPVENAQVRLFGPNGTSQLMTYNGNGDYVSADLPEAGQTYRIEASADGFASVQSTNQVPEGVTILSVDTATTRVEGFDYIEIRIRFQDQVNFTNHYDVFLTAEKFYTGDQGGVDDTTFYQESIPFSSRDLALTSGGVSTDGIAYYSLGAPFDDALFDGKEYEIRLLVDDFIIDGYEDPFFPEFSQEGINNLTVHLRETTRDYYLYNTTYATAISVNGDPFAQPVQVHTNVENGFGIFAGYKGGTSVAFDER